MVNELFYAYLILMISLFVFTLFLLIKISPDLVSKDEHTVFRLMLVSFMIYVFLCTLWAMCEFRLIVLPSRVLFTIYELTTISVITVSFMLFWFMLLRIAPRAFRRPYVKWLAPLPYFFTVILIATNYWTKVVYTIDSSQHIQYEWGYNAVPIITIAYFAEIMLLAAVKYRKTTVVSKRRTYRLMIEATLYIFIVAYVDNMFRYLTVLPVAAFGAILFIFVNVQESGINSDKLTLMNNRRKADDYLSDRLKNVSEENPMYLYMFDVDSFKQINDRYGHAEGDDALVMTASAIKQTVGKYTGFAARFGGDEFVIAWMPEEKNADTALIPNTVSSLLKESCREKGKPYELSVSWGCAVCTDPSVSAAAYIKEADAGLYEMKRKRQALR